MAMFDKSDQVQDEPVTGNENSGDTTYDSSTENKSIGQDPVDEADDQIDSSQQKVAEKENVPDTDKKVPGADHQKSRMDDDPEKQDKDKDVPDETSLSSESVTDNETFSGKDTDTKDSPGENRNPERTKKISQPTKTAESAKKKESEDTDVAMHITESSTEAKTGDDENIPEPIVKSDLTETNGSEEELTFDYSTLTREDLLNRLQDLLELKNVQEIRTDVDNIKLNYYKKYKTEIEQLRKKFVEEGGDIDDFKPPEDSLEPRIKELLKQYRGLKAGENKRMEEVKQENLKNKYLVIDKIKELINSKESFNKTFNEFRELQKEWRSIGLVPQQHVKDLWDTYNHHVEKFYDYIKINKELRDLDLKKNLEAKIQLCEKAEELLLEPSVINAFKILQKYHDQWREIGPVPPEMRTEIWDRFREATSKINKKHQQYYEDLKKVQKKNLEQKTLLCEKVEEISNMVLSSHKEWNEKSQELVELQKVWRSIGFAPKKDNNKIYQRFRTACDAFFDRKREFYSQNKEMQTNNLQLKTDLCIQAEALQESTEWKKTTEDLINLQKQWKNIGPVPKKQSDQVWKRFRAACDHFFNRKSQFYDNIDQTYESNLAEKEKLLKEIEKFKLGDNLEENFKKLNEFQRKWTEIGFVPFKDKDDIQDHYRVAINAHFDNLSIDDHDRNLLKFKNRLNNIIQKPKSGLKINQEREKFVTRLQQLKNDIVLWENNIGFFAKSKSAQTMIDEVNTKIANARNTILLLEAKIEMIDSLDLDRK